MISNPLNDHAQSLVARSTKGCLEIHNGVQKCQRVKPLRQRHKSVLHPHDVPTEPWQIISINLIGELPESNGYNGICVFVDRFTKQIHVIPTNMTIASEGMAKMYKDQIFQLHGIPTMIIHDRGPQFDSHFMKDWYKLLQIEGNFYNGLSPPD